MQILPITFHPCLWACLFWRAATSHKVLGVALIKTEVMNTHMCCSTYELLRVCVGQSNELAAEHTCVRLYLQHVWSERRSPHVRAFGACCGECVWCGEVGGCELCQADGESLSVTSCPTGAPCWYNQCKHTVSVCREREGLFFNNCWCSQRAL